MTESFKSDFRDFLLEGVKFYLDYEIPFKIMIKAEDNWSKPLPKEILESNPEIMTLDIVGWSLENSYIEEESVIIKVAFGDEEYEKEVLSEDFFALFSIQGTPVIVKPFAETKVESNKNNVNNSMSAFARNNKGKFGFDEKS